MEKVKAVFNELKNDRKLLRQIYAVTLAAALLLLVLVVKGPEEQGRLVTDGHGDVVSISRHSLTSGESYDVTVSVTVRLTTVHPPPVMVQRNRYRFRETVAGTVMFGVSRPWKFG